MKKLFAIFLVLTMLIPMGLTAQAAEVGKQEFYVINWDEGGGYDDFENVYYTPYFWTDGEKLEKTGVYTVSCPSVGGGTPEAIAANLKELFDTYPEGARYVNFTSPIASPIRRLSDICFQGHLVPQVAEWMEKFFKAYKEIGGKIDGIISDVEYTNIYAFYIHSEYYKTDPLVYNKIVNNPEYQEKIRPELVKRGFKFYSPVTENTPEIFGIHPNAPAEYASCDEIWDTVMQSYQSSIVDECCAAAFKYFPDIVLNNYSSVDGRSWINGSSGGNREAAGNASNEVFYSTRPSGSFFKDGNKFVFPAVRTRVDGVFENTNYNRFLYEANYAKTIRQSADEYVTWWIAHAYYNNQAHNAYYAELLYHLGMQDPEAFHGYIMRQDCVTDGSRDEEKFMNALKITDQCLEQLNKVAGYADRKAIITGPEWNHEYVMSGMYAGGRNIWRLTPNDAVTTLEACQVKDAKDPTFKIGGETITFPGGKIITDDEIYDIGTFGFWIETAADVTPVVTRVAEHFRLVDPTYQETFEGFEAGTEWNFNNAKPATAWENKKQGSGTAVVIADPANANNKVVEVKGGYHFQLVKIPKNVRAGDAYAKNQAWEVTVTIPADVAEDDELQLLKIIPEKKTAKDKGFKIVGTKVYYDNAGSYVEMTGVTLTAGGKYTFIREMDFSVTDAFTCDYYVYDATGALVGKMMDIPAADKDIPVYSLGMTLKNPSGAGILLDDFRIYPTKTTASFATYNAETGIKAAGTETGNVAYRLSWLNTAQTEKSYTVMAAYYDGETLISEEIVKEIKLPANGDGVTVGVAENKQAGKVMKLYLKDNNPAEGEEAPDAPAPGTDATVPAPTDPNAGAPVEGEGSDNKMIIIIAAGAAVVVIAVVVIVIVASKKKKKAVSTEETAAETTAETPEEKTEE